MCVDGVDEVDEVDGVNEVDGLDSFPIHGFQFSSVAAKGPLTSLSCLSG